MIKDPFETQEEKDKAVVIFKELRDHRGWKLYVTVLDFYIQNLTQRILNGEGESIEDVNRMRDSVAVHKVDKNILNKTINEFTGEDPEEIRDDPYDTPEDLEKRAKELDKK